MQPTVSCILATKNRRRFMQQSIKYFLRQSYENKELIVVEDGEEYSGDFLKDQPKVEYIHLDHAIALGDKLNIGIERAKGQVIQKWDDDDYYSSDFLKLNIRQ